MYFGRLKIRIRNPRSFLEYIGGLNNIKLKVIFDENQSTGKIQIINDKVVMYSHKCEFSERIGLNVDIIEMGSVDALSDILEHDIYNYPLVLIVDSRSYNIEHYIDYDRKFLQYMTNPREPSI